MVETIIFIHLRLFLPFQWIATAVSFYEVVPHWDIFTELGKQFCYDGAETQDLCINLLGAIGGQSVSQTNTVSIKCCAAIRNA